jgi:hypothetical protein
MVRVPVDSIAKANLEIDVEEEFRRAKEREMAGSKANANEPHDN